MKARIVRLLAAAVKPSYREMMEELQEALPAFYIIDFTDSMVIYQDNGDKYWQRSFSMDDKGEVVLGGDAVEVEREVSYVKATAAMRFAAASENSTDGYKWRVQIIEAGPDKQGSVDYPYDVLKAAMPLYEGARVFSLSEAQHTAGNHPYGKPVGDIVGFISNVSANATGLEGDFNILKSAKWLRDMIVDAWDKGKKDLVGLSHDVMGKVTMKSGKRVAEKIVKVDSVDVVYDPIGGGKFLRMAAAAAQAGLKEADMFKRLLAALRAMRPDLAGKIDALETKGDGVTDADISQLLAAAMPGSQPVDLEKLVAAMKTDNSALDEAKQMLEQARIIACGNALDHELKGSGLPSPVTDKLHKLYAGKVFETETLHASIKEEKEILDKLMGSGLVTGHGDVRVQGEPERLQAAMDLLFGVNIDEKYKDEKPFASLRSAYQRLTGDTDVKGMISRDGLQLGEKIMDMLRLPAAYSSSSFSYVLGNTLYRRLIQDYKAVDYSEDILVSYYRNARDFKTMESINIGYFGDLPDVTPETEDYGEINMVADEEVSYSLNQKGVIFSITRKTVINDDVKSVQVLVNRVGRAAKRTYARRLWNKLLNNATYKGDSVALFHANHGNLGSVALTADATGIATLTNRLVAMFGQVEKGSGEVLALNPLYLAVPRPVLEIAKVLNSPWPIAGSVNPHAGRFGANHERIIPVKLATDTNDWYMVADKNDVELLEVAFLNNQREPELFVADNPLVGQMFVGDKIQYKMRHEYEVEIADWRGFDKTVC